MASFGIKLHEYLYGDWDQVRDALVQELDYLHNTLNTNWEDVFDGDNTIVKGVSAFKTIVVTGQNDIVADDVADTLNLVAGTGITITTDDTTDTITISSPITGGITQLTGDVLAGPGSGSQVATIAPDAVVFSKMQNIVTDSLIGRDSAGTGDPENITLNATLSMTGAGVLQRAALTGDVTAAAGSNALAIANNAVTNAHLADVATATFKGRTTAGAGDPEDLTATQATALLNVMVGDSGAGGTKGLVPAPAAGDAGALKFLLADGTWAVPTGTSSGGHLHGLERLLGDGSTTVFNLVDIVAYLEHVGVNGVFVDPATFSLSTDGTQITFAVAPGAGEIIVIEYVIRNL